MSELDRSARGGAPVARHLLRGAVGFGLIASAFVLAASDGPAALLLAVPGIVALRGCPMCWLAGLIQVASAGRYERSCADGACARAPARPRSTRSSFE